MTQTDHEPTREAPPANGLDVMKRAIVGTPMPSDAMEETLLRKTLALPIFASDPFSSVAYATESAMVVLVATSLAATRLVFPLSIAISVLLVIVIASYRQTVRAYSTSGGSYVVSKENLGGSRASLPRPRSSSTTSSRSPSRSPPASSRSRPPCRR